MVLDIIHVKIQEKHKKESSGAYVFVCDNIRICTNMCHILCVHVCACVSVDICTET